MATLQANEWAKPIFRNQDRYLILYGGAGSGKSVVAAQKHILRLLSAHGERFMVVRQTFKSIRNSTFHLLRLVISNMGLQDHFTTNKTELSIHCKLTGSEILSVGLDDVERVKSISGISSIWIEEASEINEADFDQLDLRLRGETPSYKQETLTFNPISKEHWLKRRFVDSPPESCTVKRTTYLDNRFIDSEYVKVLESLRDKNPEYYRVYALGEWGEPVEGFIFRREFYEEYDVLPADVRGVVYCDPNLAKRGQGDTTAIVRLVFSPSTAKYYVTGAVCRSFSDSNDLLGAVLKLKDATVKAVGFDGNVTQESQWTNNVRNWCRLNGVPFPVIDYKRYRVDDIAKNTQLAYSDRAIVFPRGFRSTTDGERFIAQMFAFAGKKAKNPDDAPDALISAFEFLHERSLARRAHTTAIPTLPIGGSINW